MLRSQAGGTAQQNVPLSFVKVNDPNQLKVLSTRASRKTTTRSKTG